MPLFQECTATSTWYASASCGHPSSRPVVKLEPRDIRKVNGIRVTRPPAVRGQSQRYGNDSYRYDNGDSVTGGGGESPEG